jgi:mannonate dehydratase
MNFSRRKFVFGSMAIGAIGAIAGCAASRKYLSEGLVNPCLAGLPPELANHELVRKAWEGVRADQVWDCHTHVAGIGAADSGIVIHPDMDTVASPWRYLQKLAYMNAACAEVDDRPIDVAYIDRLQQLMSDMPPGYKAMLLAFDWFHDADGNTVPERSTFYVPNEYVQKVVAANPARFEWLASVHPYRKDAIAALEAVAKSGARGIKWLPAAQGMHPASPKCLPFYDALARLKLPLLVHCGEEKAVHGGDTQHFGNPLYMRAALDRGVKVIVAH